MTHKSHKDSLVAQNRIETLPGKKQTSAGPRRLVKTVSKIPS